MTRRSSLNSVCDTPSSSRASPKSRKNTGNQKKSFTSFCNLEEMPVAVKLVQHDENDDMIKRLRKNVLVKTELET